MSRIELRKAIRKRKSFTVEVKSQLHADKCDGCGKVFEMEEYCNDKDLASLRGTFDKGAADKDGRGLGNMFFATACSFACAHEVFTGGWKKMKQYKPFKKVGAILARGELTITPYVKNEDELVEEWDDKEDHKYFDVRPPQSMIITSTKLRT
jgi:hypothetical protein